MPAMPQPAVKTVLVVDDDPVILGLLQVNFEMEGFRVLSASDGEAALEVARRSPPDVIILDVMMPKLDGHQVARALRDDPRLAAVPVIFLSARAQSADVAQGLELGAADYVSKPFDPIELVDRVQAVLDSAGTP